MTTYEEYKQFMENNYPRDGNLELFDKYKVKLASEGYIDREYVWEGDPVIVVLKDKIPIAGYVYAYKLHEETLENYIKQEFGNKYSVRVVRVDNWDVSFEVCL